MNHHNNSQGQTRRDFIRRTIAGSAFTLIKGPGLIATAPAVPTRLGQKEPWYRRAYRWGQTNINELDPKRYDIDWWRGHWKRTQVQGLVVNAGGIVAYYPSKFPLQYRAKYLDERDLYGELTRAAHQDGIAVLARMDSNRAQESFYRAHPDWFAVDPQGQPYRAGDRYITCVDGPYYSEYLPAVLREIIAWEKPEGFTDNSWSGLGHRQICYCPHSRDRFRKATGRELPRQVDWDDPDYREWFQWSCAQRVAIWDLNNRTTQEAGGRDCLWLGMLGGDLISQGTKLRDIKALCERTEVIMLDDQGRDDSHGFQENAEMGKRLHGLLGWEKIIPESMAQYQRSPTFRKTAASPAEATLWMIDGFAGQIQPWWHHVGAYQWDRRQFKTAVPICQWHAANQEYLVNRRPVATVGVLYSQRNVDFYGRDRAQERVAFPYYGMIHALVQARIPYLPVHLDHLERECGNLSVLLLPNLGLISDEQMESIRRFVEQGGGLLATGESSLYDLWGEKRPEFALADLFGAHYAGQTHGSLGNADTWSGNDHTYLRLIPDLGREIDGPRSGEEPAVSRQRHEVLKGFEETDILPFGGLLLEVTPSREAEVPVTFIPHFPAYPPETAWMPVARTDIPGLILNRFGKGRCAYLAADLDRRFMRDYLPDHARLLANLVRWASRGDLPLQVEGPGFIDCHLYQQPGRLILHLVNLTSAGTWRSPVHELIPVGPLTVRVQLTPHSPGKAVKLLVAGSTRPTAQSNGWVSFDLPSILDHEVAVIT